VGHKDLEIFRSATDPLHPVSCVTGVGRQTQARSSPQDQDAVNRRMVRLAVGFGMPRGLICQAILNPSTGKPIDEKTLRKAFGEEIRMGACKERRSGGSLY
jgi:hypothetical protein